MDIYLVNYKIIGEKEVLSEEFFFLEPQNWMNLSKWWDKLLLAFRAFAPGPHWGLITSRRTSVGFPTKIPGYAYDDLYLEQVSKSINNSVQSRPVKLFQPACSSSLRVRCHLPS